MNDGFEFVFPFEKLRKVNMGIEGGTGSVVVLEGL